MSTIAVLTGSNVTSGGSEVIAVSEKEVNLFFNCQGTFTGGGSIQFSLQEVDPGDQTTLLGSPLNSGIITTAPFSGRISLPAVNSGFVSVTWTVVGAPTITGVYLTLVEKPAAASIPYGPNASATTGVVVAAGAPNGSLVSGVQPVGGIDASGFLRTQKMTSAGAAVVAGLDSAGTSAVSLLVDSTSRALAVGGVTADGANRVAAPVLTGGAVLKGNSLGNTVSTLAVDEHGRMYTSEAASSYAHITSSSTTLLRSGVCTLHRIVVNATGSNGSSMTVYDNTVGAAPVVASLKLDKPSSSCFLYDVALSNGLTVAVTGSADVTIIYG